MSRQSRASGGPSAGFSRRLDSDRRIFKPISFWQLTRYGLIVTAITIAVPYMWLSYL